MPDSTRLSASLTEEGRTRLLLDSITDYAIYMLDPDGTVVSWNTGAERFKGYKAAEIIGQNFSRFYTEADRRAGMPERALAVAAAQGRFEREGWRIRKDGAQFWAHVLIDAIRDPDGSLLGFAKVTRDLTERREAEEAMRTSEQQFRLLVEGVTDYAIYMLDPQGRVSSWNAGAQRIKGYRPEEIIGAHFSRFYTQEDLDAGMPAKGLAAAAREGRFEKEGWRIRKDGTRFWASVVIDAIRSEGGELIGFAKVTRDITERREAQEALERARETLLQSQKMEAIGQLTGGVAHDFNNLLMAILGSLEMARKRLPDDPKLLALIDNAMQGAERGATLTQRLLAFARRQELQAHSVDVRTLVSGMTTLVERSLGPTISLETKFPEALSLVRTDPNQLEMALLNLAVNARDAMPSGGKISITAEDRQVGADEVPDLGAGRYVRLAVSDTGQGMDVETLARASEPFFTTKGVGKGTGLGLSMVHGLVQQSGGAMRLLSRQGRGTTVELWLPVATAETPKAPMAESPSLQPSRPLSVLAVDDDGLVLMNTVAMLEDLGHTVLAAASGREALMLLEAGACVDLVISDQVMPQMTGLELAAAIQQRWPQTPVLLATGYAELPADGASLPRLAKPFMQKDLQRAMAEVVKAEARVNA